MPQRKRLTERKPLHCADVSASERSSTSEPARGMRQNQRGKSARPDSAGARRLTSLPLQNFLPACALSDADTFCQAGLILPDGGIRAVACSLHSSGNSGSASRKKGPSEKLPEKTGEIRHEGRHCGTTARGESPRDSPGPSGRKKHPILRASDRERNIRQASLFLIFPGIPQKKQCQEQCAGKEDSLSAAFLQAQNQKKKLLKFRHVLKDSDRKMMENVRKNGKLGLKATDGTC